MTAPVAALLTPSAFEPRGKRPPPDRKARVRLWSVRHAALMERLYARFEAALVALGPLFARVGYARLERPVAALEAGVKGFLFDCRMCGDCVLSKTGMSCPMNCPKGLRNGPCGGVRADGNCEVYPGDGLRLGQGLRRQPRHAGRARHRRRPAAVEPRAERLLDLVASGARTGESGRMTPLARPHPHDIGADPSAPLVELPGHSSRGRLERVLRRGEFAVTAELSPPDSADADEVRKAARSLRGLGRRHQRH